MGMYLGARHRPLLSFEEKLRNYARIGLVNLGYDQKIRPLYILSAQIEDHGHFIPILAEEAYKLGVKNVEMLFRYPELERAQFLGAPGDQKLYVPFTVAVWANEVLKTDGARLRLDGMGELGTMDDVNPQYPTKYDTTFRKAMEPLRTRHMKGLQPWSILDVPTKAWADKLGTTVEKLWEFLFEVSGADRDDAMTYPLNVSKKLHERCDYINTLGIHTLHFVGDGTDLKVGLTEKARFIGGRKCAEDGTWFEPNWPSFEIFTTPDWRKTEGEVRLTMPTCIDGPIVEGLSVTFSKGRIVDFIAEKGSDAFRALINFDTGAAHLGEIALVGLDSPLSKYKEPHYSIMLDENKRCHMAVGQAYPMCLEGGTTMSPEELSALGCNMSDVHHDMMISDETTSVYALDVNGKKITQLIKDGHWTGEFK